MDMTFEAGLVAFKSLEVIISIPFMATDTFFASCNPSLPLCTQRVYVYLTVGYLALKVSVYVTGLSLGFSYRFGPNMVGVAVWGKTGSAFIREKKDKIQITNGTENHLLPGLIFYLLVVAEISKKLRVENYRGPPQKGDKGFLRLPTFRLNL